MNAGWGVLAGMAIVVLCGALTGWGLFKLAGVVLEAVFGA